MRDEPASRDRSSPWPMLAMSEALKIIKDNCFPVETETVKITSGLNRIISEGKFTIRRAIKLLSI